MNLMDNNSESSIGSQEIFQDAIEEFIQNECSAPNASDIEESVLADSQSTGSLFGNLQAGISKSSAEDFDKEIGDLMMAVDMFLNGRFRKAETLLQAKFGASLCCRLNTFCLKHLGVTHIDSYGYAILSTIKALMTSEPSDISNAIKLLQDGIVLVHTNYRKRESFLGKVNSFISGQSIENMDGLQRHAELIFAELHLLKALLTIIAEDSFVAFVREGLHIRQSYISYRNFAKWLEDRHKKEDAIADESSKEPRSRSASEPVEMIYGKGANHHDKDPHLISGIRLGIGIFNLIFSLLPPKVLKLFEAVGFQGDRDYALQQFNSDDSKGGLRHFICDMILMGYHTIMTKHIAFLEPDMDLASSLVDKYLTSYPNGAFSLFFAGRFAQISSEIPQAINYYQQSIESQKDWVQFHHICHWSLSFCYTIELDYENAWKYTEILERESKWSRAMYAYQTAAYQIMTVQMKQNNMDEMRTSINTRINSIPGLLKRIAGRSIPIEKFVARKARKYQNQSGHLFLPGFELSIFWDIFENMSVEKKKVALNLVDNSLSEIPMVKQDTYYDDYCLGYLIRGQLLRELGRLPESIQSFETVLSVESKIKLDHYLAPFCRYEMARTLMKVSPPRISEARIQLRQAKNGYKNYSLENSLHLRVHSALTRLECEDVKPADK